MKKTKTQKEKNQNVCAPHLAKRLFISSSFIGIDAWIAYRLGRIDFAIWDFICMLTSLNYWRDAKYGWRRNIDISLSISLYGYHLYASWHEIADRAVWGQYLCIALLSALLYLNALLSSTRGHPMRAQVSHSTMHLIGSAANAWMYHFLR